MLMKRWEKMDSWTGSSSGPIGRKAPEPTAMQMSPRAVTEAVQPGSTRMVLQEHQGALQWLPLGHTAPPPISPLWAQSIIV